MRYDEIRPRWDKINAKIKESMLVKYFAILDEYSNVSWLEAKNQENLGTETNLLNRP